MISNAWNFIPEWISKPRLRQKKKKSNKTSNGAGMYAQKFCVDKNHVLTNTIANQDNTIGWDTKYKDSVHLKTTEICERIKVMIIHLN